MNTFELITYVAVVNKAKLVKQGLENVQDQEGYSTHIVLRNRPAFDIIIKDKGNELMTI